MTSEDKGTLTPRDLHAARADIATRGVQWLILINGGGAVALLAFLQAVLAPNKALVPWIATGILFHVTGIVLAAPIQFFRCSASALVGQNRVIE